MKQGKLFIVATPIGNLGDITFRAIEVLSAVGFVAAEDTRRTIKLLNHYDIKKPLVSFHEYTKKEKLKELVLRIKNGEDCALVSDAGTPIISDPGYLLVRECVDNGIEIESLPGACAAITAITLSATDCRRFLFAGFLSSKKGERQREIKELGEKNVPVVCYESPMRVKNTVADICEVLGEETFLCVARELTKVYEEVLRGSAKEVYEELHSRQSIKGEFVVIFSPNNKPEELSDEQIVGELKECLEKGLTKKEAVSEVTATFKLPKNKVYKLLVDNVN